MPKTDTTPTKPLPRKPVIQFVDASLIVHREMLWLWHPYIPVGTTTMLFGPGGIGKSHIACDICAAVTTGRALPGQDSSLKRKPQTVLMLSAEDDMDQIIQPRLIGAGADLTKVFISNSSFTLDPGSLRAIEDEIEKHAATVVFLDPLVAYLGGRIDMNRSNEVRTFTGALAQTARKKNTAIIAVHHSRKGNSGEDYEKAMGSSDFNNAVRSVLMAGVTDEDIRFMKHVKTNYAKEGPTLTYEFDDDTFHWTGVMPNYTPGPKPGSPRGKVVHFLKELLRNGPVRATEVIELAENEGFNLRTLQRAKEGVAESFMVREDGKGIWFWRLL